MLLLASTTLAGPLEGQEQEDVSPPIVYGLAFEGNRAIDDNTLRASIATSRSSWFARVVGFLGEKRYFDETEFRRDVLRIEALYRQGGFVDASVDTLVRRAGRRVDIRFFIHEGEPVRVASLAVTGVEEIVSPERIVRDLPLKVGDPFNRLRLLASADTIRVFLHDRGYPFAEVFRSFDEDRAARRAEVAFDVVPGPRAAVGEVEVVGADQIPADVVRRLIPIRPGRRYSERELYESQLDLYRMGVYNFVNVSLADSVPEHPGDSVVTVHVHVAEGPLHRVRLGTGFGSFDCIRTLTSWTGRGVLGGARQLQLSARLSKIGTGDPFDLGFDNSLCWELGKDDSTRRRLNFSLNASFTEPIFFSRRTSATVSLFAERQSEFRAFFREAFGGEISFTRQVRANVPVTLTYSLGSVKTEADPATVCTFFDVCAEADTRRFEERRLRSTVSLGVVRNGTNSLLDPTRGSVLSGELRYGAGLTGADSLSRFAKAVTELAVYHRVGGRSVFAWRVRVGGVAAPSLPDTAGVARRFVPPEERFFAGGANSVRGFGQNELGPLVRVLAATVEPPDTVQFVNPATGMVDTATGRLRTAAVGGNQLILANVELRFPLPGLGNRISGALFVDAGRLIERDDQFSSLELFRVTPGVGIRVGSPLGPVRLDVAYDGSNVQRGALYQEVVENGVRILRLLTPQFPSRELAAEPRTFFQRLQVHFSVGQAF